TADQPASAPAPVPAPQTPVPPQSSEVAKVAAPSTPAPVVAAAPVVATLPVAAAPGFGISDVFSGLFSLGMLALIAGLIKPALAARVFSSPSRGKIFGIMLVYLVPMAALSHF